MLFGIVALVFILARVIPGDPCRAALGERATASVVRRLQPARRARPADLRAVLQLPRRPPHGRPRRLVSPAPLGRRAPRRAPADDDRAVDPRADVRHPRRRAARRDRRLPRNSAADVGTMVVANAGVSMPIFVLGLLLQYLFAVTLKDTFLALPPSGRLSPGLVATPFYEQWGLERQRRARVHLQLRDPQRAAAVELGLVVDATPAPHPPGDRRRHDPAGDHRQDDPVEPARRARARLRAHGPGQGLRRAHGRSHATPCAAPCCPSSPSSGSRSARCSAGRSSPRRSSRSPASARRCSTRSRRATTPWCRASPSSSASPSCSST